MQHYQEPGPWGVLPADLWRLLFVEPGYVPYACLVGVCTALNKALDFLSRILRAGHSLSTGLQMMSEELPQPLSREFRRAYDQHSLGSSMDNCLKDMSLRIESTDFAFFVTAVLIQRQTGGDLSSYPAQVRLPWTREFWTYDPLTTIRKVRQPILILQGARDRQITAEQADLLEKAAREAGNKDVTKQILPNLNHLFLTAKTGGVDEYSKLETSSIGDDVLKVLGDWLVLKFGVKSK